PAAVVFSLSLNLEGDQVPTTSDLIVRCPGGFREIQLTSALSGRSEQRELRPAVAACLAESAPLWAVRGTANRGAPCAAPRRTRRSRRDTGSLRPTRRLPVGSRSQSRPYPPRRGRLSEPPDPRRRDSQCRGRTQCHVFAWPSLQTA